MRIFFGFIFFTFVLFGAPSWSASPSTTKPGFNKKTWEESQRDKSPDPTKVEPTRPTPSDDGEEYVEPEIPRRGPIDINLHFGKLQGDLLDEGDKYDVVYMGLRYIPHDRKYRSWDYTIDINNKNLIHLNVGYRWYFEDDSYYKGYYRISLSDFINSGEGLAGLINLRHMKAVAAVGASDLFGMDRKWVLEAGAGYGMSGAAGYLQLGYNFNF